MNNEMILKRWEANKLRAQAAELIGQNKHGQAALLMSRATRLEQGKTQFEVVK